MESLIDGLTGSLNDSLLKEVSDVISDEVQKLAEDGIKSCFDSIDQVLDSPSMGLTEQLKTKTRPGYDALRSLLSSLEGVKNPSNSWRPQHTGLEFVLSEADGTSAWVSAGGKNDFLRHGQRACQNIM